MAELVELSKLGWYLSEKGLEHVKNGEKLTVQTIISRSLDIDIYEIGAKWLPDDINKGKVDYINDMGVLQINKIRNITAPKSNEESDHAPRMLKVSLSDGHVVCHALELERIEKLSLNTPPGTKIKLCSGKIPLRQGLLLLDNSNVKILGGHVESLVTKWKLAKSLASHSLQRSRVGQGGPPPWVPFGKKSSSQASTSARAKQGEPFRAMDKVNVKKEVKEDGEFEQQRQATIAEASKSKSDKGKDSGSRKQTVQSSSYESSEYRSSSATSSDLASGGGGGGESGYSGSNRHYDDGGSHYQQHQQRLGGGGAPAATVYHSQRGGGGAGGYNRENRPPHVTATGGGGGMRGGYRDGRPLGAPGADNGRGGSEGGGGGPPRPSAPATLFDYLEDKIPASSQQGQSQTVTSTSHNTAAAPPSRPSRPPGLPDPTAHTPRPARPPGLLHPTAHTHRPPLLPHPPQLTFSSTTLPQPHTYSETATGSRSSQHNRPAPHTNRQDDFALDRDYYTVGRGDFLQGRPRDNYAQGRGNDSQNRKDHPQNRSNYSQNRDNYLQGTIVYSQNRDAHPQGRNGDFQNRDNYHEERSGHSQNRENQTQRRNDYSQNRDHNSQGRSVHSTRADNGNSSQYGANNYPQGRGDHRQGNSDYTTHQWKGYNHGRSGYPPGRHDQQSREYFSSGETTVFPQDRNVRPFQGVERRNYSPSRNRVDYPSERNATELRSGSGQNTLTRGTYTRHFTRSK